MKTLLALALQAAAVAALPQGFTTYFQSPCPTGWSEIPDAKGRMVVSVTDPSIAGLTLNQPLGPEEDRTHTHSWTGNFTLPSKNIAADSCCDTLGAPSGTMSVTGETENATSGMPFTQLFLCKLNAEDDTLYVPFGGVGYFTPDVEGCPANWTAYSAAQGRVLIGGYIQTGGVPVPSFDAPLSSLEDRAHSHNFVTQVSVPDLDYVGIDGCCNDAPAPAGQFPLYASTDDGGLNLPYIQLLTCASQGETFNTSLPAGALLFSPLLGCVNGWVLAAELAGRFPVALPDGGVPGASFGGASLASNATGELGTSHSVTGTFTIGSDDVGLAEGCCASGYALSGPVNYNAQTSSTAAGFPYLMAALCQSL